LKNSEDIFGRAAGSKPVDEGILDDIVPCLVEVLLKSSIENCLKMQIRGHGGGKKKVAAGGRTSCARILVFVCSALCALPPFTH